jgi:predicted amidohydrolase
VLHTTAVLSQKGIDLMRTTTGTIMNSPGGGSSAIFGPDGRQLSIDLGGEEEEGILYADIDLDEILKVKGFLDSCGHYSRPDLLWLGASPETRMLKRIE